MSFKRVPERSVQSTEALTEKLKALGASEGIVWTADVPGGGPTFFSQLNHMKECERILEVAEAGGHFDDIYESCEAVAMLRGVPRDKVELHRGLVERAHELLADEYPDVEVRIRAAFGETRRTYVPGQPPPRRTYFVCVGRGVNAKFPSPDNSEITAKLEAMCRRSTK